MPYGPPASQLPPYHPPGQPFQPGSGPGPQTLFSGPNMFAMPGGPANRMPSGPMPVSSYRRPPARPTVHGAAVHPKHSRKQTGILVAVGLLMLVGGGLYGLTAGQETGSDGSTATVVGPSDSDTRSEDDPKASQTDPADTPPGDTATDPAIKTKTLPPDTERKADIDALEKYIIAHELEYSNYPALAELNDEAWQRKYMKDVDTGIFTDPESKTTRLAEKPTKTQYSYQLAFDEQLLMQCSKQEVADCTSYAVSAVLSDGTVYRKANF